MEKILYICSLKIKSGKNIKIMKTLEEYHEEVKRKAIDQWAKGDYTAFKNMENDPVINLLLSALSYQAYHIRKEIDLYEENILRDFRDRIIPFHLIKPVPAFSIVETGMMKDFEDTVVDENCPFEFRKYLFYPLLETRIMNARLENIYQEGKSVWVELQSANPIENLSGLSFYLDDISDPVEIEAIRHGDYEFPLIKPCLSFPSIYPCQIFPTL